MYAQDVQNFDIWRLQDVEVCRQNGFRGMPKVNLVLEDDVEQQKKFRAAFLALVYLTRACI